MILYQNANYIAIVPSMIVNVDADRCRGHGICCALCPDVFELTDDGYAIVRAADIAVERESAVRDAVLQCPERAITAT